MIGAEQIVTDDAAGPSNVDLHLTAEELAVLCRGREERLARLLPELAGARALDVVERTLVARGLLELAATGGTQPAPFVADLVLGICEPRTLEHVTVDELGGGPGFWVAIAHGDEVAVTITPSQAPAIYDVSVSGPYAPVRKENGGEPELETTLGRLEQLLTARREDTLVADPEDPATELVLGASSFVERVTRTFDGHGLAVEHRVLLDAADHGTYELVGMPSPVEGDDVDRAATIAWVRVCETW